MSQTNINPDFPAAKFVKYTRKRALLPWWIKVFCWLFMVSAVISPVGLVFGVLKKDFQLEFLGISTNHPLSIAGLLVIALFIFNGIVGFALWTEKEWAVRIAKIDAVIGITVCVIVIIYAMVAESRLSLRLELVLLILFNYKLNKIQYEWENFDSLETEDPFAFPPVNQ